MTAPARKPGRTPDYCQRPDDAPRNAHVPKYGYHVQHAMIRSDKTVMDAIYSLKPKELPNNGGWMLRGASVTVISAATKKFTHDGLPMPRRTVAHRLAALRHKGIARQFEEHAKNSPVGATLHLPLYASILDAWAADPDVATVGKRAFFVKGKGRFLLTPTEFEAWKLDTEAAARNPQAQASGVAIEEPTTPAPAAADEKQDQKHVAPEIDLEQLRGALSDACHGAESKDARWIWDQVLAVCGAREVPSVEDVAEMVERMGRDWRRLSKRPITHGLVRTKIGAKLEAWYREGARIPQGNKGIQIRQLAEALAMLARSDLPDADRAAYMAFLANADPGDVERARRINPQTRTA